MGPGQIEKRFEAPPPPRRVVEPEIPETEKPLAPDEARKIKFILSAVVIEGATVYAHKGLIPLYEKMLAREVTLADIYDVANEITEKYQKDGYILSHAFVPPQKVQFGIVRIQVIEGFVDRVIIRGEVKGGHETIGALAEKITRERPLSLANFQRYILLINDLPGVDLRPAIRPSSERENGYDLVLSFTHDKTAGFASLDNRGTRFVGADQILAGVTLNSVFGLYEAIRLRAVTASQTEELRFGDINYQQNWGGDGGVWRLVASHYRSQPGFTLADSDVDTVSTHIELNATYPVIRARLENLFVSARITYRDSLTDAASRLFSDDRLRVAALSTSYNFSDDLKGANFLTVELSRGFETFGASSPGATTLSRANGRPDFTKITASTARQQELAERWSLALAASGQLSANALLAAEEFAIGGAQFGRAYDPSELTGDDGVAAKAELQYSGDGAGNILEGFQLYAYYDFGAVWRREANGQNPRNSLTALGAGVRLRIVGGFSANIEIAKPLARKVAARGEDGGEARLFFAVGAEF